MSPEIIKWNWVSCIKVCFATALISVFFFSLNQLVEWNTLIQDHTTNCAIQVTTVYLLQVTSCTHLSTIPSARVNNWIDCTPSTPVRTCAVQCRHRGPGLTFNWSLLSPVAMHWTKPQQTLKKEISTEPTDRRHQLSMRRTQKLVSNNLIFASVLLRT